jgi:hypothetical protein
LSAQNPFLNSMEAMEKRSDAGINDLLDILSNPGNTSYLNPKAKTGRVNLDRVLEDLIRYSRKDWVQVSLITEIFTTFSSEGMDFSRKGKDVDGFHVLQKYVYQYDYQYQNIGLLIYEAILLEGFDPFFAPDKKSLSMLDYAVNQISTGSVYLDVLIRHIDFNKKADELRESPFIWFTSKPTAERQLALTHLTLYDKDLDINQRSEEDKTSAFDRAIVYNEMLLANILIKAGIDLTTVCKVCAFENYLHRIALHNATNVFATLPTEIIARLINQADINGKTPIFWALENENSELAIEFARAGANLNHKANNGKNVMETAMANEKANHTFILMSQQIRTD